MAAADGKKRGLEHLDEYEPKAAKHLRTLHDRMSERRLVVILEGASLESVKVGKNFELLNCDQHKNVIIKSGRDPGHIRPDITHQCLLMLMDSPLNRAGLLQVYIHTDKNGLIEINPQTRIPRTFPRFCGLMVQLLHKLSVRASDGPQKLLKMIKNPVSDHLPPGCPRISTSFSAGEAVCARSLVPQGPAAVVIGAFAHGAVNVDYAEKTVSISNYPLSAAVTCSKICSAFEEVWGVL
ncbi:ribosomal RNA small subunit methyltransferase NEP1 [Entelurus aequoreus]|uniref:ribosomal RNA small subunit methyltransferase NEP1 n=1 Tax=Entelurus aequoreus TaxID=161455 RepID=UPI002B1E8F47|nr:ribosomal RNA small subunit methyltransferase NEP1 [Entelurus aequoreus]